MYRTHRFTYRHFAQEYGASSLTVPIGGAGPEPIERLIDDRSRLKWSTGGNNQDRLQMNAANQSAAFYMDRLVIPKCNVFDSFHLLNIRRRSNGTTPNWNLDGGESNLYYAPFRDQLFELHLEEQSVNQAIVDFIRDNPGVSASAIGELWWSFMWQPVTGEVFGWEHPPDDSNQTTTVMQSGEQYTTVNGERRRRFEVEHRGVRDQDLLDYDQLFESVGTHRTFYYEHSDSGDYGALLYDVEELGTSGLTPSNGTLALTEGPTAGKEDAILLTSNTGLPAFAQFNYPAGTWRDFRPYVLSVDFALSDATPMNVAEAVNFEMIESFSNQSNIYWLAYAPKESRADDRWYRVFIDLTSDDQRFLSDDRGPDLRYINQWRVGWTVPQIGDSLKFANIRLWDKRSFPVLVRFTRTPERVQDSRVPNGPLGPSYTIRMEMEEVLG